MLKNLLLPHRFQKIGWAILLPVLVLCIGLLVSNYAFGNDFEDSANAIFKWLGLDVHTPENEWFSNAAHWINNICILGVVVGGILVGCSRERTEDEMIARIRLNSLLLALWINYGILIVASLVVYGSDFINVMIYNLFTMLIIFVAVFRIRLWRLRKEVADEE